MMPTGTRLGDLVLPAGTLDVNHSERQIGVQVFFGGDGPHRLQNAVCIDRIAGLRRDWRNRDEEEKQRRFQFECPCCRICE